MKFLGVLLILVLLASFSAAFPVNIETAKVVQVDITKVKQNEVAPLVQNKISTALRYISGISSVKFRYNSGPVKSVILTFNALGSRSPIINRDKSRFSYKVENNQYNPLFLNVSYSYAFKFGDMEQIHTQVYTNPNNFVPKSFVLSVDFNQINKRLVPLRDGRGNIIAYRLSFSQSEIKSGRVQVRIKPG